MIQPSAWRPLQTADLVQMFKGRQPLVGVWNLSSQLTPNCPTHPRPAVM